MDAFLGFIAGIVISAIVGFGALVYVTLSDDE